ncbi:putative FAD-linked sulfhydryl oxidase [Yalta virus]|nr:putative FAD-linked sulfhydryl oxidase [Yalta virus]
MEPKLFGRGTWYFIFKILFYFYKQERKQIDIILYIRSKETYDSNLDNLRRIFFKDNDLLTYEKIQKENKDDLINIVKRTNVEQLKKKIHYIIHSLPCEECKQHSLRHIGVNHIFESISFFYIFHFFLELRNRFYPNVIQRTMFNNGKDLLRNEKMLLQKLLNTNL